MRKKIFLSVVLSLCMVNYEGFAAATRTNARGSNANQNAEVQTNNQSVSARAARRNVAKTTTQPSASTVSARAGAMQNTVKQNVSARAGATQKVIQTGSKVAVATENTTVPIECQNAFYGCMDSFCMLDNVSGGRCQCSNRGIELDKVLDEILKIDEQTYIMATEGVERIQMGEAEEQVLARVKAMSDEAAGKDKTEENKKKARQLNLSQWNNNIFGDDADDLFNTGNDNEDNFADKQGDDLYKSAAKMCGNQIPSQCKDYSSMLQLVYAQKIKSDCVAYENSLKQQKNASQQKLFDAQKALRDAALDEYRNQNKYATTGECVTAFDKCMQTTAGCGADYTGCITFAAEENVRNVAKKNTRAAAQTTIKGVVKGADVTLSASTMESLLAKKEICRHITKQCVNSNKDDAVWNAYLRNIAPTLKSAEKIAEDRLRTNCIPTLSKCFQNACKLSIDPNNPDGSYDICLTHPETYKSFCKVELEPCLEATGGTYENPEQSTLWNGLIAALNAMKVDACTKQIKDCLTSEDACGADYSACVGLGTEDIVNLCPIAKLTACTGNGDTVVARIEDVAKGLYMQIDNSMLATCENAVEKAIVKICGSTEDCAELVLDKDVGISNLNYGICEILIGKKDGKTHKTIGECKSSIDLITSTDINNSFVPSDDTNWISINDDYNVHEHEIVVTATKSIDLNEGQSYSYYTPYISGTIDWGKISYKDGSFETTSDDKYIKEIVKSLNTMLERAMSGVDSDPTVTYCKTGRKVQGLDLADDVTRFPNLTDSAKSDIANYIYLAALNNYNTQLSKLEEKRNEDYLKLGVKYGDSPEALCASLNEVWTIQYDENGDPYRRSRVITSYNETKKQCTFNYIYQNCEKKSEKKCTGWGSETKESTKYVDL